MTQSRISRAAAITITVGCLIAFLTFGVRSGFGLFLEPMSATLGWGREIFAFAIALQNLLWGLGQPIAGMIADRYGSGRVLATGGVLYAAGIVLMAYSSSPLMLTISAGVLIGLGLAGVSFSIVLAAISRMVSEEKRSWALGVGTAAGSLGQFLLAPLGQAFISAYGWSVALLLLSAIIALVIPLSSVLTGKADSAHPGVQQSMREALYEASRHPSYLYLTGGFFVCGFHIAFLQTHLPAYLSDAGIAPAVGAWALALVGLFNVIGAYSAGVLGGGYSKKYLLSFLYLARAVTIAVFVIVPISTTTVLIFAAVMGLFWLSTVPLTSGLVAQMLGTRYMATLFGIVFFAHQIGAFLGVWLGGYFYDATGSYDIVWLGGVVLGLVAAVLHWPIDERQVKRPVLAT